MKLFNLSTVIKLRNYASVKISECMVNSGEFHTHTQNLQKNHLISLKMEINTVKKISLQLKHLKE